jgi:hypothetical protein
VGDVVVKHTRNDGKTQKQLPNAGRYTLCVRAAECPHLVFVRELNTKLFEVRFTSYRPHLPGPSSLLASRDPLDPPLTPRPVVSYPPAGERA